jgi:hypothetical protein
MKPILSSKARFDGVVGYHVSLTSMLGSLKVSSSSLGRIIFLQHVSSSNIFIVVMGVHDAIISFALKSILFSRAL